MVSQEGKKKHDPGAIFCNMRMDKTECFSIKRIASMDKNNPNQEEYKCQRHCKQDLFCCAARRRP